MRQSGKSLQLGPAPGTAVDHEHAQALCEECRHSPEGPGPVVACAGHIASRLRAEREAELERCCKIVCQHCRVGAPISRGAMGGFRHDYPGAKAGSSASRPWCNAARLRKGSTT